MEDPFAALDAALALQEQIDDGEDEPYVVFLATGDIHVCKRNACPHASVDQESKQSVCLLSGVTWGGVPVLANSNPFLFPSACIQIAFHHTPDAPRFQSERKWN